MDNRNSCLKRSAFLAAAALALSFMGCGYVQHRCEDAMEMVDLGITYSSKPSVAVQLTCPFSLIALVGGQVDGTFVGIGGGQIGATPHYLKGQGLVLFGREDIGWGEFDKADPTTLYRNYQGLLGIPAALERSRPAYMPSCTHEIHLGWVGLVLNVRYTEIADFLLGLTTLDLACDDGRKLGRWPWQTEEELDRWAREASRWPWGGKAEASTGGTPAETAEPETLKGTE